MTSLKIIFWICIFIILYSYLLYGLLVWILLQLRSLFSGKKKQMDDNFTPEVTLLVASYNEGAFLTQKIENCLNLDYPEGRLKFMFVTDGSTDQSNDIIQKYPQIQLLFEPGRKGKVAAINRAMKFVTTEFVIFCDANTELNRESIREIVKHYADPEIGAVAGEKVIRTSQGNLSVAGAGEGLYWKYESFLKRLDSEFYTVVGAAGELFSVRTALFAPVPENVLLDDFIISLKIAEKGYRVTYEPKAFATEAPSLNIKEEQKRKIRIGAGGFQSIVMLRSLLNIFKYPKLSFQYISHRVLRWALCPFLLPVILILNILIYWKTTEPFYGMLLLLQCIFYLASFIGFLQASQNRKSKLFYVPYYFVFMNISLYFGLFRYLRNTQTVLWDKAARSSENIKENSPGKKFNS